MITKELRDLLDEFYKILIKQRDKHKQEWTDISTYIATDLINDISNNAQNEKVPSYKKVFDTTAQECSNILVDGLGGYSFGRTIDWFKLKNENLYNLTSEQNHENKKLLQAIERIAYALFNTSNFYSESRKLVSSSANLGTGIMTLEWDETTQLPYYKTLNPKNCGISENRKGEVDTLFREFWLPIRELIQEFGEENVPNDYKDKAKRNDMIKIIQYCGKPSQFNLPINSEWCSVYYIENDTSNKVTLREDGFDFKPFVCWRWNTSLNGSAYGVGSCGQRMISNVLQLQKMQQANVRLAQMIASPPIAKTKGLKVNFTPGALNDLEIGEDFAPKQIVGDLSWSEKNKKDLQMAIRNAYNTDFFLALMSSDNRQKTATEVNAIQEEKASIMSSFTGILTREFLEPVIENITSNIQKYILPLLKVKLELPKTLLSLNDLKVDYVSPLAMIQKRNHELNGSKAFINEVIMIASTTGDPTVMDNIDMSEYISISSSNFNVDERIIRDKSDVEKMQREREQQQLAMQQQQLATQQQQADNQSYMAMSKAPEQGSPMEQGVE